MRGVSRNLRVAVLFCSALFCLSSRVSFAQTPNVSGGRATGSTCSAAANCTVQGTANIFGSGHPADQTPAPAGVGGGTAAPVFTFTAGAGQAISFTSVTGAVFPCSVCSPPLDGGSGGANINGYKGITGFKSAKQFPLVGVFLDNTEPTEPAPATLDFNALGSAFTTLSPGLRQVFYIGDGKTNGAPRQYVVPATATRMYLGFADAFAFTGNPGYYDDNIGSVSVTFALGAASSGGSVTVACPSASNLIQNCGAEAGPAAGFSGQRSIPQWTTDGNVAVIAYTDSSGDLTPTSPGPTNRGNNYFAGGTVASSQMTQTLDLSASASAIDAGTQAYTLDGWLGGWDGQDDNVVVTATFQNASGATLGTAQIASPNSSARNGTSELLEVTKTGTIPSSTRKVLITVLFTRVSGVDNDSLADNLFFGLTGTSSGGGGQPGCSYNVNPSSLSAPGSGASGTFLVFTNTGCAWTTNIPAGVDWITLSPSSGSGQGGVGYSVKANSGAARSATITVATISVTVNQAAGATCSLLGSASQTASGSGGVIVISLSDPSCGSASIPIVPWVHVTPSAPGTVTLVVDPNPGPSQRSTTLTIAGQTVTVTQYAPPCSYSLSASSANIVAAGGTGSAKLAVPLPGCGWSVDVANGASANFPWLHITSAKSATASGNINYTVDPNTTTSQRNVTLTITGQNPLTMLSYAINQAAGAANTGPVPVISPGGVLNAASGIPANLPAGALAQGSFFSIYGTNLGPDPFQKASSYPLQTTLAGVSVKVTQGSVSVQAIPQFVAAFQINAVLPSNTPTGTVQVTVTFNGATSAPAPVQVVVNNFGSFALAGGRGPGIVQNFVSQSQLPLNSTSITAAPSDAVILWGTGLGPLPNGASDAQPPAAGSLPVSVQVFVGTVPVQPFYSGRAPGLAGVDQINFFIPQNAPQGCYVPIQVVVAGLSSNTITIAIGPNRQPCTDTNPFGAIPRNGGKNGTVGLVRLNVTDPTNPAVSGLGDLGLGVFSQQQGSGDSGFSLYTSLPPLNTCTYYNNLDSLNGILGGQLPSSIGVGQGLDAGPALTVKGTNGVHALSYSDSSKKVSPYVGVLGANGVFATLGLSSSPAFLDPGTYTVSGPGGNDVGPFSFTMSIPPPATWTNRDQISSVDRGKDLTISWSGGDASKQAALILGFASLPDSSTSGGFACLTTLDKSSFTIPSATIANLPSTVGAGQGDIISALLFATVPQGDQFVSFSTSSGPSLSGGLGYYAIGELRIDVVFK